ncbi:MAG: SemiSWEET transporter [Flavobacteriaceae bacterium]|nr:SemiSWEET transporter [Flavobacteriaceae bacterium]
MDNNFYIEAIGIIAAILTTSGFIPQLYKTIKTKNVDGVSLSMFLVLFIGILFWLVYGFLINSIAIKLANIFSGIIVFSLIVLRILYKKKE